MSEHESPFPALLFRKWPSLADAANPFASPGDWFIFSKRNGGDIIARLMRGMDESGHRTDSMVVEESTIINVPDPIQGGRFDIGAEPRVKSPRIPLILLLLDEVTLFGYETAALWNFINLNSIARLKIIDPLPQINAFGCPAILLDIVQINQDRLPCFCLLHFEFLKCYQSVTFKTKKFPLFFLFTSANIKRPLPLVNNFFNFFIDYFISLYVILYYG